MKGVVLSFTLPISDSTDIFGVMIKCMQSVTPHHKFVAEHVKRELIQLPIQDFSFLLHSPYAQTDYWSNIHSTLAIKISHRVLQQATQLDPHHHCQFVTRVFCDAFPEEVIMLLLQCRMLLSDQHRNRQNSATLTDLGEEVLRIQICTL